MLWPYIEMDDLDNERRKLFVGDDGASAGLAKANVVGRLRFPIRARLQHLFVHICPRACCQRPVPVNDSLWRQMERERRIQITSPQIRSSYCSGYQKHVSFVAT